MEFVLLIVAALGIAAAIAFYLQFNAVRATVDGLKKTADENAATAQKAAKDRDQAKEELTRRKTEAAELREKLNEIRQKQYKAREGDKSKKVTSVVDDLNAELADVRRDLDEAYARNDVMVRETAGMQAELAKFRETAKKLEEQLKAARDAAASKVSAPAAVAASAASAAVGAVAASVARPEKTELDELKGRVMSLELQVKEARRKAAEAEDGVKNVKGRLSTAQRMAQLQKSELDLFKAKLVWSEKRVVELERLLFDNKIALPEREPSPQPAAPQIAPGILAREGTNTGGEGVVAAGADYVPEETPAPAATEAAPAAEAAPVATSTPTAVPPVRRPKADEAAKTE